MPRMLAKSVSHFWRLCARKPMAERVDMSGRAVVVTGASPGSAGYETARILASWGARVVATSLRDAAFAESRLKDDLRSSGGDENNITVHALDLRDADSVAGFATWYRREHDEGLHVLVNNAGIFKNIFATRRKPPMTKDGFEAHWRTNYLGTFHLTTLLLPCLKQGGLESGDARVVNVSSSLHDRVNNTDLFNDCDNYNSWDAYALSKLALIHFSFEIDRRFAKGYGLRSVALHPGSANTNLTRTAMPEGRVGSVLNRTSSAIASLVLLHRTYGAQTAVMCASKSPLQGGRYYERCKVTGSSDQSRQESVSRELWDRANDWVRTLGMPRAE